MINDELTISKILEISSKEPETKIWCINMELGEDFISSAEEIEEAIRTSDGEIDDGWKFKLVQNYKELDGYNSKHINAYEDEESNDNKEYYLCYGEPEENILYFSERHAKDNWGDDWNDAPYDCNAGTPYNEDYNGPELGVKNGRGIYNPIDIKEVKFKIDEEKFDVKKPCDSSYNCSYTVEDINNGAIAWLYIKSYVKEKESVAINADCTLTEFKEIIENLGGTIEIKEMEK